MDFPKEFDAIKFCEDYGLEYWTEGKNTSPGWVSIACPWCNDHSNHGAINPYGAYFSCWRCGGHSLYETLQLLTGDKYVKPILEKYGYVTSEMPTQEVVKEDFFLPGGKLQKVHKDYIAKRGFDPEFIEREYLVRGTLMDKRYPYRIITPVMYNGDIVSFLGRDFTGKQNRHKDCPIGASKIHHKKILYDLDNCRKDSVIVVEGAYDKWRMGKDTCATLGTSWTDEQALLLSKRFSTVFILFDHGVESQDKAKKLASHLNLLGVNAEVIKTEYDEPDHIPDGEVVRLKQFLGIM